uniref:Universal stress protein n=1 Tax=Angiostrongylus cantonensis TaxID=6313 RepID=A0A0K0D4T7_ANGCA
MKHVEDKDFRYDDLVVAVHDRQQRLIRAVELAERFAAEIIPLDSWLTQSEKRLSALGKIPTDVEIMEKKLVEQLDLEEEVYQRGEDVNRTLADSDEKFVGILFYRKFDIEKLVGISCF